MTVSLRNKDGVNTVHKNSDSSFIRVLTKKKCLDMIRKFKNSEYTDWTEIYMSPVKGIQYNIECIAKELTDFCTNSSKQVWFPTICELQKSFLFKDVETDTYFPIIHLFFSFFFFSSFQKCLKKLCAKARNFNEKKKKTQFTEGPWI